MRSLYNALDRSTQIKDFIKWLSMTLATQRGLPVIGALVLTVVSLLVHLLAAVTNNLLISICGFSILHFAIFIGFLGVLLAEPLGRG